MASNFPLRAPEALMAQIKELAAKEKRSANQQIEVLLTEALAARKPKRGKK